MDISSTVNKACQHNTRHVTSPCTYCVRHCPHVSDVSRDPLGNTNAHFHDVLLQSTVFVSACYNMHNAASMTESRIKLGQQIQAAKEQQLHPNRVLCRQMKLSKRTSKEHTTSAASEDVPYNSSQTLIHGLWLGKG